MNVTLSQRLQQLPPYLFADIRRKMADARARGVKVITLGIGDPDSPTPDPIVAEAIRAVDDKADLNRHRYGCDLPVAEFPASIRRFYQRRWGVELAENQVVTTMGSKDAIVKFCMATIDPGDVGIAPAPGYPTYNIGHVFAGGGTYFVPLRASNGYLVDFKEIPHDILARAKVLWLNYPNNPTTAVAPLSFFAEAVEFGRRHNLLIAHDSAYSGNTYDGYDAPSILQIPGAEEVAIEFFSLSKAFNMTGWRAGCAVGNASAVAALNKVQENVDNGTLRAIQFAAAKAMDLAEQVIPPVNAIYRRRRDLVIDALNAAGWQLEKPKATIYVWAPVPPNYVRADAPTGYSASGAFVADLLEKTGVVVTPGRGYGPEGEGYFRISLTYPDATLQEAMTRIIGMKK